MVHKSLIVKLILCVVALSPVASIPSHATEAKQPGHLLDSRVGAPQISRMLETIYASQRPVGFQQLDVTREVMGAIPLGTTRDALSEAFRAVTSSRVAKETPGMLVIRDDRGKAVLDPDARSIIMTFSFDTVGKVSSVNAVYLKNQ